MSHRLRHRHRHRVCITTLLRPRPWCITQHPADLMSTGRHHHRHADTANTSSMDTSITINTAIRMHITAIAEACR